MIAYLILAHRYPNQFKKLFTAIYDPNNYYLIHIDKKSGLELQEEIRNFIAIYPKAAILKSENTLWGGYSLVNAELRGIVQLLKMGLDWEFFINLSAQDFPIKPQKYIHEFLKNNIGTDFIKISNQLNNRPNTLHRIENYVTEYNDKIISEPIIKRNFLNNVTPYIGNQWMILTRKFCEFVSYSPEINKFKEFYKNTLIADEGFFQTVIMNTSYKSNIVNDDKRTIDWVPMGTIKLRPRDFTSEDIGYLMGSNNLFARKFDETVDKNILDIINSYLLIKPSENMALSG
ncbi:MAG: beta-1,6-N-acetylglucosaminyltransferase [Burkholderiales bacterium]|nr:beta-1,6-N-acetylglucosaminyltransferase [Burkholderiales bacterium]